MYKINHSFKPKIFVPYVAVQDNIGFVTDKRKQIEVLLSDGSSRKAYIKRAINVLSADGEKTIKDIYGLDTMTFLKKWYATYKYMNSLEFLLIELT